MFYIWRVKTRIIVSIYITLRMRPSLLYGNSGSDVYGDNDYYFDNIDKTIKFISLFCYCMFNQLSIFDIKGYKNNYNCL